MQAGAIARFAGITAYGDTYHGEGFHFTDITGWTDAPDVDMDSIKRPAAHGRFVVPAWLDERVVRLPGFVVAKSHMELEHSSAKFRGLISRPIRLVIEDALETAWVDGTVTGASFRNHGFAPEGTWSLEVTCEDPRKFGKVHEFAAGAVAYHRGNFDAWPTFVVTGASPGGYTITGLNGQRIVVTTPLVSGTPHMINTDEGEVMVGGSLGNISVFEPWTIGPGMPGVTHTISAGTLLVKVPNTNV